MNNNIRTQYNRYAKSKISEQTKMREILQQTALLGLSRQGFFEKAAFYGGTALRILYGLDRFSEDLDFTLLHPEEKFDFTPFLEGMKKELFAFGFKMEVTKKNKTTESSVVSAFMKMNTLELYLAIGEESKGKNILFNEKVQIKLEVDTSPPAHARYENRLVLNPSPFYVLTLNKSDLFAGKMSAILFRSWKGRIKGRDWYDLIWYIQNKVPLNLNYLDSCLKQTDNLETETVVNEEWLKKNLLKKIGTIDWEVAKADVRSFITDQQQLDLWSSQYFTDLIPHILFE